MSKQMNSSRALQFGPDDEKVVGAFLGAACGDALGWPFEGHAKKRPDLRSWRGDFCSWEKVSGGRFRPSVEQIRAGEYSDDTQLILAISRCLLKVEPWWLQFALVELPFWTSYERGGGGATKRAATGWLSGVPPWHDPKSDQIDRYLKAGGNGVAMRILPHCVLGARATSFDSTALNIVTDGVITHGHPRALVGALAYGFAAWKLLSKTDTLQFGELVDEVLQGAAIWGGKANANAQWPDWLSTVLRLEPRYLAIWDETIDEMVSLLKMVREALADGALTSDQEVLRSLGALNLRTNGAGTVTSASALYFASRYAASPIEGLVYSASMVGADTDTLSSMTGALLGALSGRDWLEPYAARIQDHEYISTTARSLNRPKTAMPDFDVQEVNKARLGGFVNSLPALVAQSGGNLPNGMEVQNIVDVTALVTHGRSRTIWKVESTEGLTFYIRGSAKQDTQRAQTRAVSEGGGAAAGSVVGFGISLTVTDVSKSRFFYERALGMSVSGETRRSVRFDNSLVIQEAQHPVARAHSITLFINVLNAEDAHARLRKISGILPGSLEEKGSTKSFEVRDPDGYLIEVYERVVSSADAAGTIAQAN